MNWEWIGKVNGVRPKKEALERGERDAYGNVEKEERSRREDPQRSSPFERERQKESLTEGVLCPSRETRYCFW